MGDLASEESGRTEGAGEFGAAIQIAAIKAQAEIAFLMPQGYQEREAAEVVLPMFILLKQEPSNEDD